MSENTQTTDVEAWLTALEEARKAATPGPWVIAEWHDATILSRPYLDSLNAGEPEEVRPAFLHTSASSAADAALIVAAVDALPELVAVVRGVLALAEELEGTAEITGGKVNGFVFADKLRAVVAAAHTEEA